MARKTLLTESEIRRFMKLASMGPVGNNRLHEIGEFPEEEEAPMGVEEMPEEEPVGMEPEGDMDPGADEEPMGDDMTQEVFMDILAAIEEVAAEHGVEMSSEESPAAEEEEEMSEEEPEMEFGAPPEEAAIEGVPEEEPPPGTRQYQEALVKKVAQRVAARLMQENKNEKLATELTERIFNRITSN